MTGSRPHPEHGHGTSLGPAWWQQQLPSEKPGEDTSPPTTEERHLGPFKVQPPHPLTEPPPKGLPGHKVGAAVSVLEKMHLK